MGPQVKLVPVSKEHAPVIQELVTSHPDIVKLTRLPDPYPEDGAKKWIQYAIPRHQNGDEYSFVITNTRGNIVGTCGLIVYKKEHEAELGYWIGRPYWNRGYATAAIHEALTFAFKEKNFKRVFALPLLRNKASCVVLEKNGFRKIETRENTDAKWKESDQIAVYEVKLGEWKK